jgi:uncharacterized SAM-binding protein YcdF (DUF218 family)
LTIAQTKGTMPHNESVLYKTIFSLSSARGTKSLTTLADRRHRFRRRLIVTGILVLLAIAGAWSFLRVGAWLVVEDPLTPTPVAVVLSGEMPARAREAAEIYRTGIVKQVWITRPDDVTKEMHEMGIDYLGETFYNQSVLLHLHVPIEATRVLDPPIVNTQDEVLVISEQARAAGMHSVIIVTSKAHTRRVHAIWKKLVGADPALIVRYASEDPFDPEHWWRHTADALQVVREVLGLANVWSGFLIGHRGT